MKHVKLFEQFVSESKIDAASAMIKIEALPKGSMFADAKKIDGIFKKSSRTWSEVVETFEKNKTKAKVKTVNLKDIKITQPNIQSHKVEKMLDEFEKLPLINVVDFSGELAIYDGHHRLMAAWALGQDKIKVNLVK
jgi:hypothetical protein